MNIFKLFNRQRTAPAARERLQLLLAHERSSSGSDLINLLREEILAVISRHVQLDNDKVQVKIERSEFVSTLEIDVELPLNATLIAA